MEAQSFDLLEEKISNLIGMLNRLRIENQELKNQNQEMRLQLDDKEQLLSSLKNETDQLRNAKTDVEMYKQNQDRIANKVDSLLMKLKEFEDYQ